MEKVQLRDLTGLQQDVKHSMKRDVDLPNGEQSSKSAMDSQVSLPLMRLHTRWLVTVLSARTTVLCQSLSQRFLLTDLTLSKLVPKFLRKCSVPS